MTAHQLSQEAQDFRRSVSDRFTSLRRLGLGTRLSKAYLDNHVRTVFLLMYYNRDTKSLGDIWLLTEEPFPPPPPPPLPLPIMVESAGSAGIKFIIQFIDSKETQNFKVHIHQ